MSGGLCVCVWILAGIPCFAMAFHNVEPPAPRGDWFSRLFGFAEESYDEARRWLRVERTGPNPHDTVVMESLASGARYGAGAFETPSLGELRARGAGVDLPGRITVSNELGDVAGKHALPENRLATFQVASQFNCLEFVGPSVVPEDGVTRYVSDRTQGPACSIACGAATVFRNYFAHVKGATHEGQRRHCQIDNLQEVSELLGNSPLGKLYDVRGGYTLAKEGQLALLNRTLRQLEDEGRLEEVRSALRIGVHSDAQVTSIDWGRKRVYDPEQKVTQVFGSACAVAYNSCRADSWKAFASLVLEASYEATLWAALLNAVRHQGAAGSRRVFLTCLGGGVFGNSMDWIMHAMRRAVARFEHCALDVRVVTFCGQIAPPLLALEQEFSAARPVRPVHAPAEAAKPEEKKEEVAAPEEVPTPPAEEEALPAAATAAAHVSAPVAAAQPEDLDAATLVEPMPVTPAAGSKRKFEEMAPDSLELEDKTPDPAEKQSPQHEDEGLDCVVVDVTPPKPAAPAAAAAAADRTGFIFKPQAAAPAKAVTAGKETLGARRKGGGSSGKPPAKAARVAKTGSATGSPPASKRGPAVEQAVLDEAKRLGYDGTLRSLAERPDVQAARVSSRAILDALKASEGLLHPAKRLIMARSVTA